MAATICIGHGNVYQGNQTPLRALRTIKRSKADSWGVNEGMNFIRLTAKLSGYRTTVGVPGKTRDDRRGTLDTPVLTRKKWESLGELAMQASEPARPIRLAPERWITATMYDHAIGPVAHVNVHPNAAVRSGNLGNDRVREYAEFMATLDRLLTFLEIEGFWVFVTGDVNYAQSWENTSYDPFGIFKQHNMKWIDKHIDVIAYPRRLEVVRQQTIPKARTGADHDWLCAEFQKKETE